VSRVSAAGEAHNKKVRFIFRNGKWDLPKGGIEKERKLKIPQCVK
jgi:hypothetical protein